MTRPFAASIAVAVATIALTAGALPAAAQQPVAVPLQSNPAPVIIPRAAPVAANPDGSTRPVPLGNVGNWVALNDLPSAAMAPGNAHAVRVSLSVSPLGFVYGCTVVISSGDAGVDAAVCTALQSNAFFTPARNAAGQGIAGEYVRNVRWAPPEAAPATPVTPPAGQ